MTAETDPIVIVGAGMGGLASAAWLAKRGHRVLVLEARETAGGLASSFTAEGHSFDTGPYIVLDKPGLEWAFDQVGERLASHLVLERLKSIYRVETEDGSNLTIFSDLSKTAQEFDNIWPGLGVGQRYSDFVSQMQSVYDHLAPLQYISEPGLGALMRHGAISQIPFLLRPLSDVLRQASLPAELSKALSIWTHVAGQSVEEAPSVMAFVPALIHRYGAYVPQGGMARIPDALETIARQGGVEFRYGTQVRAINCESGRVVSVEAQDEIIKTRTVISNASVIGTYLNLMRGASVPARFRKKLFSLPLQSPGVCAYLAIQYRSSKQTAISEPSISLAPSKLDVQPYLRFRLPREGLCRLLIQPGVASPSQRNTARLLGPVSYTWATEAESEGQNSYLERLVQETWWQEDFAQTKVVSRLVPKEWGDKFSLYGDSMNPVMTAKLMRQGRLPHKSPFIEGLYFAGSATHPGQWVSFCAISGIHAARAAHNWLDKRPLTVGVN